MKAIILAEGHLSKRSAKTTHGLLRISRKYDILGVVDSTYGKDSTEGLVERGKTVPVFHSVKDAFEKTGAEYMIIGVAPAGGRLPENMRASVKTALSLGINVVSGLHEFLSEDPELMEIAEKSGADIKDIRKSPPLHELKSFSNLAEKIEVPRVPVLGTDSSIGKRTTAWYLVDALRERGLNAVMVATGQTGLLQGADYGIPLDAIQGDYMVGMLEWEIYRAYRDGAEVIVVEGQGALSHPAYVCGSRAILSASQPEYVLLQHAPGRKERGYHREELHLPMPDVEYEMKLIKDFSGADVIAISINNEGLESEEEERIKNEYERKFGIPAFNPLKDGMEKGVEAILSRI